MANPSPTWLATIMNKESKWEQFDGMKIYKHGDLVTIPTPKRAKGLLGFIKHLFRDKSKEGVWVCVRTWEFTKEKD